MTISKEIKIAWTELFNDCDAVDEGTMTIEEFCEENFIDRTSEYIFYEKEKIYFSDTEKFISKIKTKMVHSEYEDNEWVEQETVIEYELYVHVVSEYKVYINKNGGNYYGNSIRKL